MKDLARRGAGDSFVRPWLACRRGRVLGEPRTVRELGSAVDARLEVQARRPDQGELFHFYGGVVLVYLFQVVPSSLSTAF